MRGPWAAHPPSQALNLGPRPLRGVGEGGHEGGVLGHRVLPEPGVLQGILGRDAALLHHGRGG